MKLETPLISMILMGIIFFGLFTMFTSMADTYGGTYNVTAFETGNGTAMASLFNEVNDSKTEIVDIKEDFEDMGSGDTSSLFGFLSLGYKTGKALLGSLSIFDNLLFGATEILGLDSFVVVGITAIIMILFVVSVIMILLGRTYSE